MGGFSVFMTMILGIKFLVKPVATTKDKMEEISPKKRIIQSIVCGCLIGFICGFIGAGGGMMMLLVLTSVFIMAATALTGSMSHFAIGGMPEIITLVLCVLSTLLWARIAAKIANKAKNITLNRVTGIVLVVLGAVILGVNYLT